MPCNLLRNEYFQKFTGYFLIHRSQSRHSGSLATGLVLSDVSTRELLSGHCDGWYKQKNHLIEHMCYIGEGSSLHSKALTRFQQDQKLKARASKVNGNIMHAAIIDVQLIAASAFRNSFGISCFL